MLFIVGGLRHPRAFNAVRNDGTSRGGRFVRGTSWKKITLGFDAGLFTKSYPKPVYSKRIKSKMIMIIAPTERYTPPPISLSSFFIVRTSLRKARFSDELRFDLSIASICSNLFSKTFASADSTGVVVFPNTGLVSAFTWVEEIVNNRRAVRIHKLNFFMFIKLRVEKF